jgi:hypothetical protein
MDVHVDARKISSVCTGNTTHRGKTLAYEEPSGTAELSVVIIRLLAVALAIDGRRATSSENRRVSLPADYARWPAIECERQRGAAKEAVTFYVNPKGAATLDEQAFPCGTVFVMETYAIRSAGQKDLVRIFVMVKREGAAQDCHADAEAGAWQGAAVAPMRSISR